MGQLVFANEAIPFKDILDRSLRVFFLDALRVTLRNPREANWHLLKRLPHLLMTIW
jgi:hypothetical protein